jgi:aspartate/methionine/tyrosine aminotransferase
MIPTLSPSIRATPNPPIPAARKWAARYGGGSGPAIDLTQAVPGYPPHPELLQRLSEAAGGAAAARYGDITGDMALREALAADMCDFYAPGITAADVVITAGCNLAFGMAMAAIAGPGTSVLLPAPWYFNHHMTLTMQGIATVPLPCDASFVADPEQAAGLITAATRAIVLVSPNNPTGAVYPAETIARFSELCRMRGLWLVLDETYRDFLPAPHPHRLFEDPAWRDHLVHLYSFSKAYCIPGHRVGAIAAGPAMLGELAKVLDSTQICPSRTPQSALVWAIDALRDWRAGNRAIMAGRADAFRAAMSGSAWKIDAMGAYFAYLRIPEDAAGAMQVAEHLAAERGLMSLPGPFFGPGQDRHLRLAFANAELDAIAAVPARLAAGIER